MIDSLKIAGPLRVDRVLLPDTNVILEISRPDDLDRLLDASAGDPEQNLPYWAELWPSGIALASAILRNQELVRGKRVLELGCGLGVTAIAALRAGADLLVTDYAPEAISLCSLNALKHAGVAPKSLQLNWRNPSSAFLSAVGSGFPVVLAADVLYEERDIEPLLDVVGMVLTARGTLLLAEPGRRPAARFLETMRERGWHVSSEHVAGPWPDPEDNRKGVTVSVHQLKRVIGDE